MSTKVKVVRCLHSFLERLRPLLPTPVIKDKAKGPRRSLEALPSPAFAGLMLGTPNLARLLLRSEGRPLALTVEVQKAKDADQSWPALPSLASAWPDAGDPKFRCQRKSELRDVCTAAWSVRRSGHYCQLWQSRKKPRVHIKDEASRGCLRLLLHGLMHRTPNLLVDINWGRAPRSACRFGHSCQPLQPAPKVKRPHHGRSLRRRCLRLLLEAWSQRVQKKTSSSLQGMMGREMPLGTACCCFGRGAGRFFLGTCDRCGRPRPQS